jgi:hypothetical protein
MPILDHLRYASEDMTVTSAVAPRHNVGRERPALLACRRAMRRPLPAHRHVLDSLVEFVRLVVHAATGVPKAPVYARQLRNKANRHSKALQPSKQPLLAAMSGTAHGTGNFCKGQLTAKSLKRNEHNARNAHNVANLLKSSACCRHTRNGRYATLVMELPSHCHVTLTIAYGAH